MHAPKCCGRLMRAGAETGKFMEMVCARCGDVVYVKKSAMEKPQLIDD